MLKKENRKGVPVWAKITLALSLVIAVILIGTYLFVDITLNKIRDAKAVVIVPLEEEYFEIEETENLDGMEEGETEHIGETVNYKDIIWPEDGDLLRDKDIINILLIGQDRSGDELRARADTMMIATLNKKNNSFKITSLMRDLYVQIPGYSDNRINAAYAFGGMTLLDAAVEKNFGIHIDGNIEVDFNGFQQVIDKIGGIEIDVNAEEAHYLTWKECRDVTEGAVLMDGALALAYARIRYVGNADYERTERQRRVMTTVFNKLKGLRLTEVLRLTDVIFPLVTTDLSNGQMMSLAASSWLMRVETVGVYRIPIEGAYEAGRVREMAVLIPDLSENRIALNTIIYGD